MRIVITRQSLFAFAALILLCGLGHEFVHHATAALLCQSFGEATFNSFRLAADCANRPLAFVVSTWAGPLFTFALMWFGWHRLRADAPGTRQLGLALIFANFPLNRLLFALLGGNDEMYVTRVVIGNSTTAYLLTNLAIWVMVLPPLVAAWRALAPRHRPRWFAGLFVLPFVFVLLFGVTVEEVLLLRFGVLAERIFGIPALMLLVALLALAAWIRWRSAIADADGLPAGAGPCRGREAERGRAASAAAAPACRGKFIEPMA